MAADRGEEWWLDVDGSFYIKYTEKGHWIRAIPQDQVRSDWFHGQAKFQGPFYTGDDMAANMYSLHLAPAEDTDVKYQFIKDDKGKVLTGKQNPFIKVKHANISTDFWKFRPLKKTDDGKLHVPWLETSDENSHHFQAANWRDQVGDVAVNDKAACAGNTNLLLCSVAKREGLVGNAVKALAVPNPFHMVDLRRVYLKGFLPFLSPEYYSPKGTKGYKDVQFFTDGLFGFDSTESSSNNYWHERISPKSMSSRYGDTKIKKFTEMYEEHSKVDDIKFVGLMSQLQNSALKEYRGIKDKEDKGQPPAQWTEGACKFSKDCSPGFGCMQLPDGSKKCVHGHISEDKKAFGPGQTPNCYPCNDTTSYSLECKSKKCHSFFTSPADLVASDPDFGIEYHNPMCIGTHKDCDECGSFGQCCMSDSHCKKGKCMETDPGWSAYSHICMPAPDLTPEEQKEKCEPDKNGQVGYNCPCSTGLGGGPDDDKCKKNLKCASALAGFRCKKPEDVLWKNTPGATYKICKDNCADNAACMEDNGCKDLPGAPKVNCKPGTWSNTGLTPCTPCKVCSQNETQTQKCFSTADTICVAKKGTCKAGTWSKTGNTPCEPCKLCDDGEKETQPCTYNTNRKCAPPPEKCVPGSTWSNTGAAPCTPCTECKYYQQLASPCYATSDAVCKDAHKKDGEECNDKNDCAPGRACKKKGFGGGQKVCKKK